MGRGGICSVVATLVWSEPRSVSLLLWCALNLVPSSKLLIGSGRYGHSPRNFGVLWTSLSIRAPLRALEIENIGTPLFFTNTDTQCVDTPKHWNWNWRTLTLKPPLWFVAMPYRSSVNVLHYRHTNQTMNTFPSGCERVDTASTLTKDEYISKWGHRFGHWEALSCRGGLTQWNHALHRYDNSEDVLWHSSNSTLKGQWMQLQLRTLVWSPWSSDVQRWMRKHGNHSQSQIQGHLSDTANEKDPQHA